MFCIHCGASLPEQAIHCANCGRALARTPAPAEPQKPAPPPLIEATMPTPGHDVAPTKGQPERDSANSATAHRSEGVSHWLRKVIGWIAMGAGGLIGWYVGGALLVPIVLSVLCLYATRRFIQNNPFRDQVEPVLPAFALQVGYGLWMLLAAAIAGAPAAAVDGLIMLGGAGWLIARPGLAPIALLAAYHSFGAFANFYSIFKSPEMPFKALLAALILRGASFWLLWLAWTAVSSRIQKTPKTADSRVQAASSESGARKERRKIALYAGIGAAFGNLVFEGLVQVSKEESFFQFAFAIVIVGIASLVLFDRIRVFAEHGPQPHEPTEGQKLLLPSIMGATLLITVLHESLGKGLEATQKAAPQLWLVQLLFLLIVSLILAGGVTSSWARGARQRPSRAARKGALKGAILGVVAGFLYALHVSQGANPASLSLLVMVAVTVVVGWIITGFAGGLAIDKRWGSSASRGVLFSLAAASFLTGFLPFIVSAYQGKWDPEQLRFIFIAVGWGIALVLHGDGCDQALEGVAPAGDTGGQKQEPLSGALRPRPQPKPVMGVALALGVALAVWLVWRASAHSSTGPSSETNLSTEASLSSAPNKDSSSADTSTPVPSVSGTTWQFDDAEKTRVTFAPSGSVVRPNNPQPTGSWHQSGDHLKFNVDAIYEFGLYDMVIRGDHMTVAGQGIFMGQPPSLTKVGASTADSTASRTQPDSGTNRSQTPFDDQGLYVSPTRKELQALREQKARELRGQPTFVNAFDATLRPAEPVITQLTCVQLPSKDVEERVRNGSTSRDDFSQFHQGFDNNFMAGTVINCIAFLDHPVPGAKVEWRWIAEQVDGFSRNQTVLQQASTVGSEREANVLRKSIKIDPAGTYRLELYFDGTSKPSKSLSFTVRSSGMRP